MSDGRLVERSSSLIAMSHGRLGECSGLMTVVTSESIKTCDGDIAPPGDSQLSVVSRQGQSSTCSHTPLLSASQLSVSLVSVGEI